MSLILKQERIGKNDVPFTVYKIRTMKKGSEKDTSVFFDKYAQLDSRITKFGKKARPKGLDEIPQIINIIWKGNMTWVGPRPLMPRDWDVLNQNNDPMYKNVNWNVLLSVKPGLIGAGYIRQENSFFAVRKLELEYVEKRQEYLGKGEAGKAFWLAVKTGSTVIRNILTGKVKNV